LTLEITEGAMIGDSSRTKGVLEQLDRLGVKISVDDFGTGYSSMVNLRHLPISELKIDRSFVSEMLVGANDRVIVNSAIDLGHNLGMQVVAEGVESHEVEAQLRDLGCDLVQGFGICRPLPLEEFDAFLASAPTHAGENGVRGLDHDSVSAPFG
jgi:EAL domain-containing protein (putative c-di-GMP-specific phosphodiesterase class I)